MNYPSQHDFHLVPWLKANFNLTVVQPEHYYNGSDWWQAFKGDYDLDIKEVIGGPSVFDVAMEYAVSYDGEMADRLSEIEGWEV